MQEPSLLTAKIRSALAPCSLGRWPTPLERSERLAADLGLEALWLKREDRSSPAYGGNKVRGLEFLLAGARPGDVFLTIGATGSTHCLATAIHAAALSCRTVLAQFPQPATPTSRAVARASASVAARVFLAPTAVLLPFALALAWIAARGMGRTHWISGGGAHPRAVVGQLLGGLELASQVTPPDAIVTPLGSGGTAAGLALAVAALRWPSRLVAVRVASRIVANRRRVVALAHGARQLLAAAGIDLPDVSDPMIIDGLGAGYGHPTVAGERARARAAAAGVELDPTYTAKAFAALDELRARGFRRVVFWHTFAPPPLPPPPHPPLQSQCRSE